MMEWQWHQPNHMQIICTSLQTDNHASTSSFHIFYRPDALPAAQPTASKHWRHTTWPLKWLIITITNSSHRCTEQNNINKSKINHAQHICTLPAHSYSVIQCPRYRHPSQCLLQQTTTHYKLIFTDHIFSGHISESGNAIASVHLSVHLYPLYLLNRLTFDLDLLHVSRSTSL